MRAAVFEVTDMTNEKGKAVEFANPNQRVSMKLPVHVEQFDLLRRAR
jgi:hypothetical protein